MNQNSKFLINVGNKFAWFSLIQPCFLLIQPHLTSFPLDSATFHLISVWFSLIQPHFRLIQPHSTSFPFDSASLHLISSWFSLIQPHFHLIQPHSTSSPLDSASFNLISIWFSLTPPHLHLIQPNSTSFPLDSASFNLISTWFSLIPPHFHLIQPHSTSFSCLLLRQWQTGLTNNVSSQGHLWLAFSFQRKASRGRGQRWSVWGQRGRHSQAGEGAGCQTNSSTFGDVDHLNLFHPLRHHQH